MSCTPDKNKALTVFHLTAKSLALPGWGRLLLSSRGRLNPGPSQGRRARLLYKGGRTSRDTENRQSTGMTKVTLPPLHLVNNTEAGAYDARQRQGIILIFYLITDLGCQQLFLPCCNSARLRPTCTTHQDLDFLSLSHGTCGDAYFLLQR